MAGRRAGASTSGRAICTACEGGQAAHQANPGLQCLADINDR
jgi:hypothetical protein